MGIDNDKDRGGRVLPGVKFSRIPVDGRKVYARLKVEK